MAGVRPLVSSLILFAGIFCSDGLTRSPQRAKQSPASWPASWPASGASNEGPHAKTKHHKTKHDGKKDSSLKRVCRASACKRKGCSETNKTDSCCNAAMFEMLRDVSNFLKAGNHTHALMYGSLLGAVRGQGIIPYTPDMDLHVSDEGISALLHQTSIPYHFYMTPGNFVRGCSFDQNAKERHLRSDGRVASLEQDDGKAAFFYMDLYTTERQLKHEAKRDVSQSAEAKAQGHNFVSCGFQEKLAQLDKHGISDEATIYGHKFPVMVGAKECLHQWYGDYMKPVSTHRNDVV